MGVRGACFPFGPVQVDTRHLQTTPYRQPRSPALYIAHDPRNTRSSQVCKRAESYVQVITSTVLSAARLAPYDNFRALNGVARFYQQNPPIAAQNLSQM